MKKKTEYKPNYAVHPIETLKDLAIHQDIGGDWVKRLEESGITKQDAKYLSALYGVPEKFLNNLQENYNETVSRLKMEREAYQCSHEHTSPGYAPDKPMICDDCNEDL